jgi:hypothetical protein
LPRSRCQGRYDLATPFFAAEYTLTRAGFPQGRIDFRYYGSGHMMLVLTEERAALRRNIRAFMRTR